MELTNFKIVVTNVVLIFDNLAAAYVSRDRLRNDFGEVTEAIEVPGFIAITYPNWGAEILIPQPQNRVEIKLNSPDERQTWDLLPQLARNARDAISHANLVAYGFNFIANVSLSEFQDARDFMVGQFNEPLLRIGDRIDANFSSIAVVLNYSKDRQKYQINISPQPEGGNLLNLSVNAHYANAEFPELDVLREQYIGERENSIKTIKQLFGEQ